MDPSMRIHPIISPPTAPAIQLDNLSPSKFPSESHRAPPMPPQPLPALSPRQPVVHVLPIQKLERQEKHGKKLNLRNPMSLLLRRRSGQVLEHLAEESLITHRTPGALMSDNFDPSIRGKIVHDFSAPRPRRNFSTTGRPGEPGSSDFYGSSAKSSNERLHTEGAEGHRAERQHTPVFKEHFEDDDDRQQNDSAVRAEALANKDFIARNSFPPPGQDTFALPPFSRLSKPLPEPPKESPPIDQKPPEVPAPQPVDTVVNPTPLSPLAEEGASPSAAILPRPTSAAKPRTRKTPSSASRSTVSMRGSRTSTNYDWQTAGLPLHMLSNSSRFSFQLANASAAQERLLEERHKQKEAAKALERANSRGQGDESEGEDEFDYDALDDGGYDGFEEDVPTVGEGWGNTGLGLSGLTLGVPGLSLQEAAKMALGSNPVDQFGSMPALPVPGPQGVGTLPTLPEHAHEFDEPLERQQAPQAFQPFAQSRAAVGSQFADDTDDLYFDDGGFGDIDLEVDDAAPFDESVFDDPTHHLYERKVVNRAQEIEDTKEGASADDADQSRPVAPQNSQRAPRRSTLGLVPSEPIPEHPDVNATQETISAYHQALALAANKAAADGRFRRQSSVDISEAELAQLAQSTLSAQHTDEDDSGVPNLSSRPSLVPDDSKHNSQATSGFSPITDQLDGAISGYGRKSVGFAIPNAYDDGFSYSSDFDCSDYDSALEDDPIIAAANAEALANDEEGIYGREFGFYAKPAPSTMKDGEAEFFQGGYFGPKDWAEVKRQRSTREPNLTPITERSEYSTRNSYVSLQMPEHRASGDRGQPSPGLAALARMSPSWEGDNMEALMKLRRTAFGGSQGSLVSGGNPTSPMNSSPVGKTDPRALWSSPISREVSGEDAIEEEIDADMLDQANYPDDDEDEDNVVDLDRVVSNPSASSHYSSEGEEEAAEEDAEPPFVRSESPTIHASLHPQPPSSIPSSPSPKSHLRSSTSPAPTTSTNPSFPSTISTSTTTAKTTPLIPPLSSPSPSSTSKPAFSAPFTPISPVVSPFGGAPGSPVSPASAGAGDRKGHSRSGSDSVAYVRERDGEGLGFRWVLERRRTGEDGGVEIVGREVVQGGRI